MVGKTYDETSVGRISQLMNEQNKQMDLIDKETENANKNILRYTIILGGSLVVLVALKYLVKRKK